VDPWLVRFDQSLGPDAEAWDAKEGDDVGHHLIRRVEELVQANVNQLRRRDCEPNDWQRPDLDALVAGASAA
jgi:hypothetical protein